MPDRDLTRLVIASRELVKQLLLDDRSMTSNPKIAVAIDRVMATCADVEGMRLDESPAAALQQQGR